MKYLKSLFAICFLFHVISVDATTVVGVAVSEGIVLAGDSRASYENEKGNVRIATDYTSKVFQLNPRAGAVFFGITSFREKNINSLVEEFKASSPVDAMDVHEVTEALRLFMEKRYIELLGEEAKAEDRPEVGFLVGGYDQKGVGQLLEFSVPGGKVETHYSTELEYGVVWRGQIDVIFRLIKGLDPSLYEYLEERNAKNPNEKIDHEKYQYNLTLQYMTLQDGIDFATFLIRTTIDMQRFSDGTFLDPGDIPGTGGSVDIAIITSTGFRWIKKKELKSDS